MNYQAHKEAQAKKHSVVNNKGYFSKTTNTMNIGLVTKNQMIGEESLLLGDRPLPYSVITWGEVRAYRISWSDLLNFPQNIQEFLKRNCWSRLNLVESRQVDIVEKIDQIATWGNHHNKFLKKVNSMSERFMSASSSAFKSSIQNLKVKEKDSIDVSPECRN